MKKFLEEQRKCFGDFEVIDFVDTARVEELRAEIDVDAPVDVHWTWEYGSEVEELRRLYEKGKVNQWNAELDLDWSAPVSKDDWVLNPRASMMAQVCQLMGKDEATQKEAAFDELNYVLSQLLHGEQAALQICGQLTNLCETMDEKWYASSQVVDEARHIEVMSKFLQRKMGTIYPIGGTLKVLLDELLTAEGKQKKMLGMQTLFEGTAVGIMALMRTESCNDFFTEMIRRVEQDESRHAAFGVLSMRRVVEEAESEQIAEMEDWAWSIMEALNANQQIDMLRIFSPKYGFDAENITRAMLALPNHAELNSIAFMHTVVPNLKRLGLITERTEESWRNAHILVDQRGLDPEAPASLGVAS